MAQNKQDLVIYKSKDGTVRLDVQLERETIWLSQAQLAKLFCTERSVITKHLRNTFNTKELDKNSVCAKFAHTAADGKTYQTQFYNLNAIISVGYPSVEEKAAHLLYFIVKNHSFVDGNKRIAAAVFLRFAHKNKLLYDKEGDKRIADNALVAMTLMIAESRPQEKDVITAMLTNLIGGGK